MEIPPVRGGESAAHGHGVPTLLSLFSGVGGGADEGERPETYTWPNTFPALSRVHGTRACVHASRAPGNQPGPRRGQASPERPSSAPAARATVTTCLYVPFCLCFPLPVSPGPRPTSPALPDQPTGGRPSQEPKRQGIWRKGDAGRKSPPTAGVKAGGGPHKLDRAARGRCRASLCPGGGTRDSGPPGCTGPLCWLPALQTNHEGKEGWSTPGLRGAPGWGRGDCPFGGQLWRENERGAVSEKVSEKEKDVAREKGGGGGAGKDRRDTVKREVRKERSKASLKPQAAHHHTHDVWLHLCALL